MNTEANKKFWDEAFDRKTRMEIIRCMAWTAAFSITVYGIKKLLS